MSEVKVSPRIMLLLIALFAPASVCLKIVQLMAGKPGLLDGN